MTAVPPPPMAAGGMPPKANNGKALTSMILGIVGTALCIYWFLSVPLGGVAVFLGMQAKKEIAAGNGTNSGMATTGLILGYVAAGIGLLVLIAGLFGGGIGQFCLDNPDHAICAAQ